MLTASSSNHVQLTILPVHDPQERKKPMGYNEIYTGLAGGRQWLTSRGFLGSNHRYWFLESEMNDSVCPKPRPRTILLITVLLALGIRLFLLFYLKAYVIENDWSFGWETGSIANSLA